MKKELNIITLSIVSVLFLIMIGFALADLPTQGDHDGTWGTHLNTWLEIGHNLTSGQVDNITDFNVSTADLANGLILNASQIRVGNASSAAAPNITGIFINTSWIDVPAISASNCTYLEINMSGLPGNVPCFASVGSTESNVSVSGNLTVMGTNSTAGNGRIKVCNTYNTTADFGNISFTAMCISYPDARIPGM